jgi:hypothetical protein
MTDLYIYYQVRDADAPALSLRVRAMQAQLSAERHIACQLKRRPQTRDGLQTWMEVYPAATDGFDAALSAAAHHAALSELIAGERHTEIFTDVDLCA